MTATGQMRFSREHFKVKVRFVELAAVREDDGFVASVPALPGVRSQGDDLVTVFANVEEALREALASYAEDGEEVPWVDDYPPQSKAHRSKWVRVDG